MRFFIPFVCCLLVVGSVYAQDYAPFNSSISKRFYELSNPDSNVYFFYADSASISGSQTTYHQYFTERNDGPVGEHPQGCYFWGGTTGHILDTTWLGVDVVYDFSQRRLTLTNAEAAPLTFNLMLGPGDSALVYENATERYYLKYDSTAYESIYTVLDSVKTYHLLHYDLNGNVLPSPLHGFVIKLGKTLGIISFLDAYRFPEEEVGLTLKGQLYPLLGTYHITYEELYPWQPGDVLQYKGYSYNQYGHCNSWTTYTVTARTETTDSIYFSFDRSVFSVPYSFSGPVPCYLFNMPENFGVLKLRDVLGIPFNKASGANMFMTGFAETQRDICGERYAVRMGESFATYCDSCRCYGSVDGYMSQVENNTYVKGLGMAQWGVSDYGPFVSSGSIELTYYSINGQTCGALENQSLDEPYTQTFAVLPNPTAGHIATSLPFAKARVVDMLGKMVFTVNGLRSDLDISHLPEGMYHIEFGIDGTVLHRKIIKTEP